MDIALAANRLGITEPARYGFHCPHYLALCGGRRPRLVHAAARAGPQHGCGPGAGRLAGELLPGDRFQVAVDVGRFDRARLAAGVHVLDQLLAGQVLHAAHDARAPAISERDIMLHAALAPETEFEGRAAYAHLAIAQRGEAE